MTTSSQEKRPAKIQFAPELLLKAQNIKLVLLDVDGVLTDGGLFFAETAKDDSRIATETIKRFNTLDGHGLKMLMNAGITPAIISGRDSLPLRQRLKALGIEHFYLGNESKLQSALELQQKLNLNWSQTATMGDDWPDLPLLCRSQLAAAPINAHIEVLDRSDWTSQFQGGHGAVRELCDLLLCATGFYQTILDSYTNTENSI